MSVQTGSKKAIRGPLAGVLAVLLTLGVMNGQWLAAQLYYRVSPPSASTSADPALIATSLDPSAPTTVGISRINVSAPIVFEPSLAERNIQMALRRGVVHLGTTAEPGQPGNVALFGHSSGQPWAPGDYKFVFTLLDKLQTGDKIFVDHKGQRYIYKVTSSRTVMPEEVSVVYQGSGHQLTLITCTPVGTSEKRLVVSAEQISPKPAAATASR
jgi:sortase A